jgi:hypothetical protein
VEFNRVAVEGNGEAAILGGFPEAFQCVAHIVIVLDFNVSYPCGNVAKIGFFVGCLVEMMPTVCVVFLSRVISVILADSFASLLEASFSLVWVCRCFHDVKAKADKFFRGQFLVVYPHIVVGSGNDVDLLFHCSIVFRV